MASGILRDQSGHSTCVSDDMCTAFVGSSCGYSKVSDVDQSLKVPLGSQLQLLSQAYAGSPFFNYNLVNYKLLPPSLVGSSSYNALAGKGGCGAGCGQYYNFACAYNTS
mgnify:CR=1 FL=1